MHYIMQGSALATAVLRWHSKRVESWVLMGSYGEQWGFVVIMGNHGDFCCNSREGTFATCATQLHGGCCSIALSIGHRWQTNAAHHKLQASQMMGGIQRALLVRASC